MGIRWQITFPNLKFTQIVNRNVKIRGRILHSPSLKDVAWLEDAQLNFLIFHTFVCKFGWVDVVRGKKIYRQVCGKVGKLTERLLAKLHPSNLVNTIFYIVF